MAQTLQHATVTQRLGILATGSKKLHLCLDRAGLSEAMDADPGDLDENGLMRTDPFQLRKRGVETKIILADTPAGIDETLVRNVAKAHAWFERIKAGETFTEIAAAESMHKNRIQQMICLAFLAPDIVRNVLDGNQPLGFTSDWCKSNTLPADWHDQRRLLATL